ncbi:MAG: hypothetical protein QOJ29_674 [Thermoleophilaceae bacterium]|jgi:hypothetical protein|nr:hypothetical protein [Thermoleophilaceae bacterium]
MSDWLRDDLEVPERVDLPTGHHLRPIRADDVDMDYPAVMGARDKLWAKYGTAWGWPPAHMTLEQDREDLAHHEREIALRLSFNYAALNAGETELLGCVYIDPPDELSPAGADAVASWWALDPELEHALAEFVPRWLTETWGFGSVDYSP